MSASPDDPPRSQPIHPTGDMLTAQLLAMLKDWHGYGYELLQRLNDSGFGVYNTGTVYRTLRHMEQAGLVSSMWDTSAAGPARRMYSLTHAGGLFLSNWRSLLDMHQRVLEQFMATPSTRARRAADEDGAAS